MAELNVKTKNGWVLFLASIASFMVALDTLVVSTSLSKIRLDLGASIEGLEWTVNAYSLCFAVFLLTAAALGDRFGRRRLFATGIGVFTATSAACALSESLGWLIAFRAVQGIGASLIMPLSVALLSAAFPPERRAKVLGVFSGVTGLAVLAGPVVGGAVAEGLAWQWIFWLNVPIGLLIIFPVWSWNGESFGTNTALDIRGLLLATGGALGLVWGLIRSNSVGWNSLEVLSTLAVGILLTILFVIWELHTRESMLPMRLFRSRAFFIGNAANYLLNTSLVSALFFLAQYLQIAQGYGPLDAGVRMLPWTATLFIVAPVAGNLVNRIGERPLIVGGLLLQSLGMMWIGIIADPGTAYNEFIAPLIIAGFGVSMVQPTSMSAVVGSVAPSEIGKASGAFNMLQLGGVFGIAIIATVFTANGNYSSAQSFNTGFAPAISISSVLSLAGALVAIGLPRRRKVPIIHEKAKV
ncbi:MFS transporter [Paenibacillus piri]|nr:MFS transporter [Paenibacillus piri]